MIVTLKVNVTQRVDSVYEELTHRKHTSAHSQRKQMECDKKTCRNFYSSTRNDFKMTIGNEKQLCNLGINSWKKICLMHKTISPNFSIIRTGADTSNCIWHNIIIFSSVSCPWSICFLNSCRLVLSHQFWYFRINSHHYQWQNMMVQ